MASKKRHELRRFFRAFLLLLLAATGYLYVDSYSPTGHNPSGVAFDRAQQSPQYGEGRFVNRLPTNQPQLGPIMKAYWNNQAVTEPAGELPVLFRSKRDFPVQAPELRVTWLGHSTLLIEIDGHRLLTDPVWGERTSPFTHLGPERFHPPPLPLRELPQLDGVLISHDHYDHLDYPTIQVLQDTGVHFYVPIGIGSHLEYWGVPKDRITELDWWQSIQLGDLELVSTPARHFSGRAFKRDQTLWTSWAILGPRHRVYFSGDTSMQPEFREIGERLGPFDITMLEAGAYNPLWADVHLGPEQAVHAHQLLRGKRMLPVHWGTFNLALHAWTEPPERIRVAAKKAGVDVVIPRPGESFTLESATPEIWWPKVPWESVAETPVFSSHLPPGL